MATVKVSLVGDSRSLERSFKRSSAAAGGFNRSMAGSSRSTKATQTAFGGLGRTVLGLGAGFLGASGLISVVRASAGEMAQSAKVTAQTNAVLKSTGGVAGVTARGVENLGSALMRKTGIDDEAIRSGENMLLTFRNIRNESGRGNDIFNQASKAVLDMDAVMTHGNVTQESLAKSAIRVGKALNDPIKGVTALRRVGVAFNEQQTKQITAMVKSGDVMGAQKLILRELNTEFGGSAAALGATLPGRINILREALRNLGGSLATQLVPAVSQLVDRANAWITNTQNVTRVQQIFRQVMGTVTGVIQQARNVLVSFNTVTGSTANTVKALVAVLVAVKAIRFLAGSMAANPYVITFTLVAVGAAAVAKKIKGIQEQQIKAQTAAIKPGDPVETALVPRLAKQIKAMKKAGVETPKIIKRLRDQLGGSLKADDLIGSAFAFSSGSSPKEKARIMRNVKKRSEGVKKVAAKAAATAKPPVAAKRKGISADQRNTFFDNMINRELGVVQDVRGTGGQITALEKVAGQIRARIKVTKDITRKLTLEEQLRGVIRQQRDLRAEAAKSAAEKRRSKLMAGQFQMLGLSATGGERVPLKTTLQRQLGNVTQSVKGTFLDTDKTRGILAKVRNVLSQDIVPTDVRAKVKEMLDGINEELKKGAQGHTRFRKANTDAMLTGLGLSPKQIQALRGRLSQVGAGGTVHGRGVGAFGTVVAATQPVVVHSSLAIDGRTAAVAVTKHQAKRRATSRRGP